MILIAIFILFVFLYSLFSRRLERTVFTAPVLFTGAGMLIFFMLPVVREFEAERKAYLIIAEMGLVLLLFSEAAQINLKVLRDNQSLPRRLLSIGMLLTILLGAVAAAVVFPELSIWEACVIAAILAPTDAGLGEIIVGSPRVPVRIRQALSVEAGLNDGLCVPFLMFFISLAQLDTGGPVRVLAKFVVEQLVFGALIGIGIGFVGGWALGKANAKGWMAGPLQQLGLVSLPILCVIGAEHFDGSMFIAAYVAGMCVQPGFREAGQESVEFAEGWGRLLNFFVFFLFGMFVAQALGQFKPMHLAYAAISLTVARMLPTALSLIGTGLGTATILFMGWFGPRGLASIVLGLVYLEHELQLPGEPVIRLAVMATVLLSIFGHGFSALPGITLYSRKIARLDKTAPEYKDVPHPGRG